MAEPPIPTKKMRWASSTAKCVALARVAAAIWSGRDAMMSRIPPRSTCATARGSNIGGLMGPLKISPPPLRVKTNKVVPTTILIYAAQLLRFRGSRTRDGRQEETDLTIASEFVTPESIRTLRKEAGGLICTTLSGEVRARIGLPFMADVLRRSGSEFPVLQAISKEDMKYDRHSAFSISVNHRDTFTGVTDVDRAKTISRIAAIAKEATKRENGWAAHVFADEFRSPGHVPLLNAVDPLLVERRGHTELTTALMLMAGLAPTAF